MEGGEGGGVRNALQTFSCKTSREDITKDRDLNWVYNISNLKHRTSGSAPDSAG
jgi:hypothetical protein